MRVEITRSYCDRDGYLQTLYAGYFINYGNIIPLDIPELITDKPKSQYKEILQKLDAK